MSQIRNMAFAAALAAFGTAGTASAATLDFTFSFENLANGGGLVTGVVRGLTDDAATAASSVEIVTNAGGFGIGEFVGVPDDNLWTLVGGQITEVDFTSFGIDNTAPDVTDSSLRIRFILGNANFSAVGLTNFSNATSASFEAAEGLSFNRDRTAVVPLPAAGWLLLTAVAALAGMRRRPA